MNKKTIKRTRKLVAIVLTMAMLFATSIVSFATEATSNVNDEVLITETPPEGIGFSLYSIYGYAADYTDSHIDSFTVPTSGSSSSSGTLQITTHDFGGSPTISITLYRPDGSYATGLSITGNGTKTSNFSNAQPGNYTVYYNVTGTNKGWISAWVSS